MHLPSSFPDVRALPPVDLVAGLDDDVALGYEAAFPFHLFVDEPRDPEGLASGE